VQVNEIQGASYMQNTHTYTHIQHTHVHTTFKHTKALELGTYVPHPHICMNLLTQIARDLLVPLKRSSLGYLVLVFRPW